VAENASKIGQEGAQLFLGNRASPFDLFNLYDPSSGGFNPPIKIPKSFLHSKKVRIEVEE
jgi:hypothetical protein